MIENSKNLLKQNAKPNDNRLRQLLGEYLGHIENETNSPRVENHFREALFEESVTAYFGNDAWMKINAR